jgi:hypothetical protein
MAAKTNLELLHGDGDLPAQPDRVGLAIDLLRARIAEEFQITERLDAKGRQAFALAAAFFAVAQTVSFSAFRAAQLAGIERLGIAVLGAAAALALLLTGNRVANSEEPQPEVDIEPAVVEEWARNEDDEQFGRLLLVHLREIADRRHESNERRVKRYELLESRARLALVLTAAEMILAIACRV